MPTVIEATADDCYGPIVMVRGSDHRRIGAVASNEPSGFRISDSERESALTALGEHMSTGRLTVDEYGDRSAKVAAAKTRGEVLALFTDLPAPHPVFVGAEVPSPEPAASTPTLGPVPAVAKQTDLRRRVAALVPAAAMVGLALFLLTHFWWFFLLPAVVVVFCRVTWGDDWRREVRGYRRRRPYRYRDY